MTVALLGEENSNPCVVFCGQSKKMTISHVRSGWIYEDSKTGLTRTAQHGNTAFKPPLDIEEIHD
jgi:hypothetical protein